MLSDLHETTTEAQVTVDRGDGAWPPSDRAGPGADRLPRFSSRGVEWWHQLPELTSVQVQLRELRLSDTPSLTRTLACAKVGEHLAPGLASVTEIEEFIAWTRSARMARRYVCFGVVPPGSDKAVGLFQIWPLEPTFRTAEWEFAIGQRFWGSGLFDASARLVSSFAFETLGVQRLEARAAVDNGRGNGALKKLGAVSEGVLRKCFLANGEYRDHQMWSILADDWRAAHDDSDGQLTREVA